MKSILQIALISFFMATSATCLAGDDNRQNQPANGGGSYSNNNSRNDNSQEDSSDRKSLWDHAKETVTEVKREYDNISGNSAAEKAADTSE